MGFKIDPQRRLNRQHPYDVWCVFNRLRVMDKLQGIDERFFSMEEIATILYSNWNELTENQQQRVIGCKLHFSVLFMNTKGFLEEDFETIDNPQVFMRYLHPTVRRGLGTYKARDNIFRSIPGFDSDLADSFHRSVIDDEWGKWIGRRNASW